MRNKKSDRVNPAKEDIESRLIFTTISGAEEAKRIFLDCLNCLNRFKHDLNEEQLEELENYSDCITVDTLYRCVVCDQWEPWECFTFYENLNLYKCDEHCGCFEYDHLYRG